MREIYFKIKNDSDMPVGRLGYTYVDFNKVIQLGCTLAVDFHENEKSIEAMTELSTRAGFMFFNNSEEGKKWFVDNPLKFNNNA